MFTVLNVTKRFRQGFRTVQDCISFVQVDTGVLRYVGQWRALVSVFLPCIFQYSIDYKPFYSNYISKHPQNIINNQKPNHPPSPTITSPKPQQHPNTQSSLLPIPNNKTQQNPKNNINPLMQNTKTYTPKFQRRNTFNEFYGKKEVERRDRDRIKTQYQMEGPRNVEEQYGDLVLESVRKNYFVGNLKPYAVDKTVFKSQKIQVQKLKEVDFKNATGKSTFYDKKDPIACKLNKLLTTALDFKQKVKQNKKRRGYLKTDTFIQSQIEDDHQNLIQDYKQQIKHQRQTRQKTIQTINNHLLTQYSSYLQKPTTPNPKNKIIKFKKSSKVVRTYSSNDDHYKPINKNYHHILNLEKYDYGIYSRSANRAIYFQKKKKYQSQASQTGNFDQGKLSTTFYKSYLGSYSQRKNILRRSQISLK